MQTLAHPDGDVAVTEIGGGRRRVDVTLKRPQFMLHPTWETAYPVELLELILKVKGPAWICDEIMRDEDPSYVQKDLRDDLLGYFDAADFAGKRILDFGCGSGASTMILAREFPTAEIVGVELMEELLAVAKKRLEFYRYPHVALHLSPSGLELPEGLGTFDFVIMSAVFEHLLPAEREVILRKLWALVRPGGALFLNQTPNRAFPIEVHSTLLPFLNYLPDTLTSALAHRFSERILPQDDWEMLLRKGIRGGTENEVMGLLRAAGSGAPELLEPQRNGHRDRIDLWFNTRPPERRSLAFRAGRVGMKAIRAVTGVTLTPNLSLAVRKAQGEGAPSPRGS